MYASQLPYVESHEAVLRGFRWVQIDAATNDVGGAPVPQTIAMVLLWIEGPEAIADADFKPLPAAVFGASEILEYRISMECVRLRVYKPNKCLTHIWG